jgi:hypothetical protein
MIKDTAKFRIEQVKAINFIFFAESPLSLFTRIANTPIIGINSKDDNNIKKKINHYLQSYKMIYYHLYI